MRKYLIGSLNALSIEAIRRRKLDPDDFLTFDKDDIHSLNFVTSASNIRSKIFHIPPKSRFDVKQMAGNIIPAIATTNAIVAGMMILLAYKIIRNQLQMCKYTYVTYGGNRSFVLGNDGLPKPNPSCVVCSSAYFLLEVNIELFTLESLIKNVLSSVTGLQIPGEITVQDGERYFILSLKAAVRC